MNGGEIVADVPARHGVRTPFTMFGGHIAPVLVRCQRRGMRVIEPHHEATAVFAGFAGF
jgi:thiamine pyrophosphate-dependent acetolactate synthase large subunit-like protein